LEIVHVHPWFIKEFIAANGPQILPSYPYWTIDRAWDTIDFMSEALRMSSSYEHIHLWLTCLHGCLVSMGLSLQERIRDAREVNIIGRLGLRHSERSLGVLKSLAEGWKDHREGRHTSPDVAFQQQPVITDNKQPLQDAEDVSEPIYQVNASDWSMQEWNALQNLTNEVILGLTRSYIMLGPSEGWNRYHRDPDGMSAHS
jgi:hypothetical protein